MRFIVNGGSRCAEVFEAARRGRRVATSPGPWRYISGQFTVEKRFGLVNRDLNQHGALGWKRGSRK